MVLTYFRRFRMEINLAARSLPAGGLPAEYRLFAWAPGLLKAHAEVKYACFSREMDAHVFPSLSRRHGCVELMREISHKQGFLAAATWLLAYQPPGGREPTYCGTIQGIRDEHGQGSIQNIGVIPEHRGQGLGSALIAQSLEGFRQAGLSHVYLEVTAENDDAIRLYKRLGFVRSQTLYKAIELGGE